MTDMTPEERAIKEFEEAFDITREEKNYLLELLRDERAQAAAEAIAERDAALAQVAMLREALEIADADRNFKDGPTATAIDKALIATEADVAAWLAEQKRQAVEEAVESGVVEIVKKAGMDVSHYYFDEPQPPQAERTVE